MALALATPDPRYRVIGDDWPFRVQFTQSNGTALDLTGATVFADVYQAGQSAAVATLSLGSGASFTTTATAGTVDFWVSREVTAGFAGQDVDRASSFFSTAPANYPNRLVPSVIDALGHKTTAQIVPIVPEDRRSTRVIVPSDFAPVTIVVGEQGPVGPAGPVVLVAGSQPPSNDQGVDGQFWIDTQSGQPAIYGPKVNGAWPAFGFLLGAMTSRQSLDFSDGGNAGFTNQ